MATGTAGRCLMRQRFRPFSTMRSFSGIQHGIRGNTVLPNLPTRTPWLAGGQQQRKHRSLPPCAASSSTLAPTAELSTQGSGSSDGGGSGAPQGPGPDSGTVVLDVGGMKCGACSAAVKRMLLTRPDVDTAAVNLLTETAAVRVK